MPTAAVRFDHAVLAASLALTALVFTSRSADPVNVPKLTVLMLCAIALVASAAVRVTRSRVAQLPWGMPAAIAVGLLVAFLIATVAAPVTTTAVLGAYGRNSGLLAYGSALVLFLAGLRVLDQSGIRVLLYTFTGTGFTLAVYGLFQYKGMDFVGWANPTFNPIIATLGNPNFAAAYMAICTPAAVWLALRGDARTAWRVGGGVVAGLCLLAAGLSDAFQGPLAASVGLFVLAAAWVLDREPKQRRAGLGALGAAAVLGVLMVVVGFAGRGPVAGILASAGSRARIWYWDAALAMWRSHPVFGVGLDTYGGFWWRYKPIEVPHTIGDNNFTNAAHSVPLHLLATGGLLLGLAYAAFIGFVAFALVRGLLRLQGSERLLLGAVGGCWAAYVVQALVSIDEVPLVTAEYVSAAGVLIATGRSRLRELRLPGAPALRGGGSAARGKGKARPQVVRPRTLGGSDFAALTVVALVTCALLWQSLSPLRADAAVRTGDNALSAGNGTASLASYEHAHDLLPGASLPLQRKAQVLQRAQLPERAYEALKQASDADPYDLGLARDAGAYAESQGKLDEARRFYDRALSIEPDGGETLLKASLFELRHDGVPKARQLLERAVRLFPDRAPLWSALGDARAAMQEAPGAREAYQRALKLSPTDATALAGLEKLGAGA